MEKIEKIFADMCDLVESLKLSDRFQNETFRFNWSIRHKKLVEEIENLTPDEYDNLERKYLNWFEQSKVKFG